MADFKPSPRQEEALDISRSLGVTASAGTGKTFILQKRFVKLLEAGIEPRNILCLTYTDKAAAEMREKIEKELRKQAEESGNGKLQNCLDNIHQCTVSTFHGFCSGILREFSLEAGIPMGYAIMDTLDQRSLITDTIDNLITHPPEELNEQVTFLLQYLRRNDTVVKAITVLFNHWDVCAGWFERLKTDEQGIWAEWEAGKERIFDSCLQKITTDETILRFFRDIGKIVEENKLGPSRVPNKAYTAYASAKNAETLARKAEILKAIVTLEPKKYADFAGYAIDEAAYFEKYRKVVKHVAENVVPQEFEDPRTRLMFDFMRAFGEVTAHVISLVKAKKADGGYLNFDDLIWNVRHLLETNAAVLEELKERYKSVMVDEVQDNDPSLTAIVRLLTGDVRKNRKLFVVGDMKQSIYGFRGADPEEAAKLLNSFSMPPVELDLNFRTVSPLIDIINTVFMYQYAEGREKDIVYHGVRASRESDIGSFTILQKPAPQEMGEFTYLVEEPKEEELLASWIRKHVDEKDMEVYDRTEVDDGDGGRHEIGWRPASYRDFAVLVRKKRLWVDELGAAFKQYGIPYHFHSGSNIYQEQEVTDILNVIKASVFHENNIALYGALISPFFGLSETVLMNALSAIPVDRFVEVFGKKKPTLWQRLSASDDEQIMAALAKLDAFRTASRTRAVPAFIRQVVRESGVLSVYAADSDGLDRIRNIRTFIEIAEAQCSAKGITIAGFIQLMDSCISANIDDDLGATDTESDEDDRVKILTTHVSKGLEYNIVIIYHGSRNTVGHKDKVYCDPEYHCGYSSLKHPSKDTNLFWFMGELIRMKNEPRVISEEKRLFYVGMTRARDHLALTSGLEPEENSAMSWLCEAADPAELADEIVSQTYDNVPKNAAGEIRIPAGWVPHLTLPKAEKTVDLRYALRRGIGVHALFEGKDFAEICRNYRFSKEESQKFRESLDTFRHDSRLEDIDEEWHELEFLNKDGEKRIIDMLVRYKNGSYAIFDFKTGDYADMNQELREKYRDQLAEYEELVKGVYGVKTDIPRWFYFVDRQTFIDARTIADTE